MRQDDLCSLDCGLLGSAFVVEEMGLLAGEHQWKLLFWQLPRGHPGTAVQQARLVLRNLLRTPQSPDQAEDQIVVTTNLPPQVANPAALSGLPVEGGLSSLVFAPVPQSPGVESEAGVKCGF